MVSVDVAPFRTVPVGPSTVMFPPWDIDGLPWEASARIRIAGPVSFDDAACRAAAGLPDEAPLLAVLEVWCDNTYWSVVESIEVPAGTGTVMLHAEAPPGTVYGQIQHRRMLVLADDISVESADVATRRGSILAVSSNSTVMLSGEGGQFPTDPADFGTAGLNPDARWSLRFRHESPEDPVLGTLTLLLNEAAPAVRILRQQDEASDEVRKLLGRELRRYVVAQVIREAVADEQLDPTVDWPEHSVGALMSEVVDRFAGGRTLDELRTMAKADRQRFEAVLEGAVPDVL